MKSEGGFSLIEVIMAASIMGVVSLGFMTLMKRQQNMMSFMEDKLRKIEIERNVLEITGNFKACKNTFKGIQVSPDKNRTYNISSIKDSAGREAFKSHSDVDRLRMGQIHFKNKNIAVKESSGLINLVVPVQRKSHTGIKDFRSIEINLFASVDKNFQIIGCSSSSTPSIDPLGINRDGWLCSCNGDFTSHHEGGATVCMLQQEGRVANLWIAPDPWTKATGLNFDCNGGRAPDPPGLKPLLRWSYYDYGKVFKKCNMSAFSNTVTAFCS